MKALFVSFAMFMMCSLGFAQAVRVGGGGGGRPSTAMALRCTEGEAQPFTAFDQRGSQYTEWRTCTNGRFFPVSNVKPLVCKQGTQALFSQMDTSGRSHEVWKFCNDGKFVDRATWEQLQASRP